MISSLSNPKVKHISSLKKGNKSAKNEFIIEGIHILFEAIDAHNEGKCKIKIIYYSKRLIDHAEGNELIERANDLNIKIEELSEKVMEKLTDVETPQGVIGIAEYKQADLGEIFSAEDPLIVILDGIQDPGNLGTIIRSANAFGVSGLILSGDTVNPYNQKVLRSTVGTIFNTKIIRLDDLSEVFQAVKRRGIKIIATIPNAENPISMSDLKSPVAIIVGSEGKGIKKENLEKADKTVSIPMVGKTESLNAAMSASIVLYEAVRQRKEA